MSRTSRHNNQLEQACKTQNTKPESVAIVNRTAIYARLSFYDNITLQNEDSIQAQVSFLKEYIANHPGLNLAGEYIDRGWTGTNFQRPGFLRMIEDIQAGRINCVLVKDLSRFGRSYWEVGYFLEVLLPDLHTRFIAVTDGFDSQGSDPGQLAVILKNILNDFYSRDLSRRFSDSYDLRKAGGVFRKGEPYGYIYDPNHPKHLTFDPELSYYVRMIFIWALEDVSGTVIAKRLRDMKAPIPSPVEYQRPSLIDAKDPRRWSCLMVDTILKNRIYTGDFVCGKSYRRKCDPFNYRPKIPEEEWVIIPDSHPGYITHEEYDRINARLKAYLEKRRQQIKIRSTEYQRNPNLYRGKLICPVCGRLMSAQLAKRNQPSNKLKYICFSENTRTQTPHYAAIGKKMLDMIVLNQMQAQFQLAGLLSSWLRSSEGLQRTQRQIGIYQDDLNQIKEHYDRLKQKRTDLFENQADYLLSQDRYSEEMSRLRDEMHTTAEQMEKAAQALTTTQTALTVSNPWLKLFTSTPYPNEVKAELVQQTIDRIDVRSEEEAEVHFLHQDYFLLLWNVYKEATP